MKVVVDEGRCEGYGTCAQIAPDLFALDDWGTAHATNDGVVPPDREEIAREAVAACPMVAIAFEE